MAETQGNRLEIRSPKQGEPGHGAIAYGNRLQITLNGEPLRFWQRVSLDLNHEEFVVAQLTIALGELVVDAEAALILEAAAKRTVVEGGG
jgi:hypothetical protein